jgi:hypothetical protein
MGDRPMKQMMTRRALLRAFAATTVAAAPVMANATGFLRGAGDIRRLRMYNGRAGESLDMIYWIEGEYIRPALEEDQLFLPRLARQHGAPHRPAHDRHPDGLAPPDGNRRTLHAAFGLSQPVHQRHAAQPVLRRCAQLPPPARRGGGCAAAVPLRRARCIRPRAPATPAVSVAIRAPTSSTSIADRYAPGVADTPHSRSRPIAPCAPVSTGAFSFARAAGRRTSPSVGLRPSDTHISWTDRRLAA